MKLFVALMSLASAAASLQKPSFGASVKADSKMGNELLSKARRLENQEDEIDYTWVAGYSLKFQGCHHIQQWNEEAQGEDDVRIMTKRLVRFRLCPTEYCSATNAAGCNAGYGDYVVDMNTYLEAYLQAVQDYNEYRCQYMEAYVCDCEEGDDQGDDWDEDKCLYDCYVENGMEDICAERNPYEDDEQQEEEEEFEIERYVECAQAEFKNDNRRRLNNQQEYFIGPYCADEGGAIYLGMFMDETCTTFADAYGGYQTYYQLAGDDLPYAITSIVGAECMDCKEPEEVDENNDGNDRQDEDEVKEVCEQLYITAGKCEGSIGIDYPNDNACTFMEGIQIIHKNGSITTSSSTANKTASVFIGIFVVAFVLLAAYVYYLKTKLDRASINLSE